MSKERFEVPEDFLDLSLIRIGGGRAANWAGIFGGGFAGYLLALSLGLPQSGLVLPMVLLIGANVLFWWSLTIRIRGIALAWRILTVVQFWIRTAHWSPEGHAAALDAEVVPIVITHRHGRSVLHMEERR